MQFDLRASFARSTCAEVHTFTRAARSRQGADTGASEAVRLPKALIARVGQISTVLCEGTAIERARALRESVERVVIDDHSLAITLRRAALSAKTAKASEPGDSVPVLVPVEFRRRGVEIKLIIPGDLHRDTRARRDPAL